MGGTKWMTSASLFLASSMGGLPVAWVSWPARWGVGLSTITPDGEVVLDSMG